MKKIILFSLLTLATLLCKGQSQLDYIDEAELITSFVKAHTNPALPPAFTISASNVPVPTDNVGFTASLTATATAIHKDTAAIHKEFLYLVFLVYETDQTRLRQVVPTFPAQFSLINDMAAGQFDADQVSSSFNATTLQSNVIYALAKFALDRAKQELVEVYLNQWYNRLNDDEVIQPLIPNTLSVFKAFNDDNSVNLAAYGDKWKTAFQEDLKNVPLKFQDETYVDKVLAKAGIAHANEIGPVIVGGDSIIYQLSQKNHLVNILDQMATNDISDRNPAVFKKLVVLTNMLLSVCGQMDIDKNVYSPVKLSTLKTMKLEDWHLLLKLLYIRKNAELEYAIAPAALNRFVSAYVINANVNSFISLVNQTLTIAANYQNMTTVPATQKTAVKTLTFNDTRQMLDLCFQLVDNVQGYRQLFDPDPAVKTTYETKIKPFFSYFSQLGEGIQTRQYGQIMDGAIGIINQVQKISAANSVIAVNIPAGQSVVATGPAGSLTIVNNATASGGQAVTITTGTATTPVSSGTLTNTVRYLQIYGSFMLNILSAKSDTAVETALNELVPQGDYKLKNAPAFTVSLSAFPGAWFGAEAISVYPTDDKGNPDMTKRKLTKTAFAPGIYLPIGVDLNWGHKASGSTADKPKYNSWGMLFQVLDLGAVLSYRVSGEQSVDTAPNISFKQVLSPGFCIIHHLTNSPVVLGGGINYSPDLRQVTQGAATYGANSLRYGVFVAVDVTFFNAGGKKQQKN